MTAKSFSIFAQIIIILGLFLEFLFGKFEPSNEWLRYVALIIGCLMAIRLAIELVRNIRQKNRT